MTSETLPLTGERKKPEPRPRTEGLVKLSKRPCYYARLYAPGAKRATYRCTGRKDVATAALLLPHLRADLQRKTAASAPPPATAAPDLIV